jgi:hypothetical protein
VGTLFLLGGGSEYVVLYPDPTETTYPDPTSKEEKNLGRILGPALRNFHAPMRSQLCHNHMTSLVYPVPSSKEEKGLVNLGRILGPVLRKFHAPRLCKVTYLFLIPARVYFCRPVSAFDIEKIS